MVTLALREVVVTVDRCALATVTDEPRSASRIAVVHHLLRGSPARNRCAQSMSRCRRRTPACPATKYARSGSSSGMNHACASCFAARCASAPAGCLCRANPSAAPIQTWSRSSRHTSTKWLPDPSVPNCSATVRACFGSSSVCRRTKVEPEPRRCRRAPTCDPCRHRPECVARSTAAAAQRVRQSVLGEV